MSSAEKLNVDGWGWTSGVLDWSLSNPLYMFLLLFGISIGLGEFARVCEFLFMNMSYTRPRFSGYFPGDFLLSIAGGLGTVAIHQFDGGSGFYNDKRVYVGSLILGYLIAIGLEADAVRQNKKSPLVGFTIQQELLVPSKWVHTLAFGPILAILLCMVPYVLMNPIALVIVGIVLCVITWALLDQVYDLNREDPSPAPDSLPEERTNKVFLFVKAHPHPSRDKQMDEWRQSRLAEMAATT